MILSYVVARDGIEPPHPGLHSGTLPTELTSGATGRARTADHPFTRRTLYLLSYRGEPMAGLEPAPTDWKSVVQPTHPIGIYFLVLRTHGRNRTSAPGFVDRRSIP